MSDAIHPANRLIAALERTQGLLSSVGTFYDAPREEFELNAAFMMQSLQLAQTCTEEAQAALSDIMKHCDLTLLPALASVDDEVFEPTDEEDIVTSGASSVPMVAEQPTHFTDYSAKMVTAMYEPATVEIVPEAVMVPTIEAVPTSQLPLAEIDERNEQFAQTYLELLQKLTAAEIFATEQQALSPNQPQQQLLPLLRSLRQDIQKLHNVA